MRRHLAVTGSVLAGILLATLLSSLFIQQVGAQAFQPVLLHVGTGFAPTALTATNGRLDVNVVGGTGAPTDGEYWVGAANGTLSAEKNLGALGTGLVINTAGVPSIKATNTCTNQFPRSDTASGVWTCASVANADLAGSIDPSKIIGGTFGAGNYVFPSNVTIGSLTSGRVPIVGASGLLTDDPAFLYNPATDTFTVNQVNILGNYSADVAYIESVARDLSLVAPTGRVLRLGGGANEPIAINNANLYSRLGDGVGSIGISGGGFLSGFFATVYGNGTANGDITIEGTSNATKTTSDVALQPNGGTTTIGSTGGNTTVNGPLLGAVQALSGAGAVNVTQLTTAYTSTGVAEALSLANGTVGQFKTIVHVVDGGSGVLTPTTALGYTTITFANAGDSVTLQYTSAGWAIVGSRGVVIA